MSAGDSKKLAGSALALAMVSALVVSSAAAQGQFSTGTFGFHNGTFGGATIHGVPPSVTSFGFGGTPGFHGVPPSVTSLNFGNTPFRMHPGFRNHHHGFGHGTPFYGGYYAGGYYPGGYYLPYSYPLEVTEPGVDDSMEQNYSSGPTIFDRSGYSRQPYIARPAEGDYRADLQASRRADLDSQAPAQPAQQQEVAPQPETVLVFKDGHTTEILNYALVGDTLYDLSDGRAKKIDLAALDLPATVKQNDERGVEFRLPGVAKVN